jgi:uncharacterized protein (DUF2141 family)
VLKLRNRSIFTFAAAATAGLSGLSGSASATVVGSDASACSAGRPSVQVRVFGLKQSGGTVGVSLYSRDGYLQRHGKLRKVEVPVRSAGPVDICIAVPRPGRYAVAVHHDLNGNDKKDRYDGGGYSRNPRITIFNLKPAFKTTSFDVGNVPARVSVQLLYAKGLTIGPARG